ncbi:GrpB family protein [Bacillus sonorensis]|nr:GrpB family protein [Bacillus sonorensis]
MGSTAVFGLAAKPVLDLMIGSKHLEAERLTFK